MAIKPVRTNFAKADTSFNFGANATMNPPISTAEKKKKAAKKGRKPGKAKWAGKRGAAFRKSAFGS